MEIPIKKQAYKPIKDTSALEFLRQIPDEEAAEKYLESLRWSNGVYCPHCGNYDRERIAQQIKPQPYHCTECYKYFSVRTGTVMVNSRLSLHNWLLAIYLMTVSRKGISSLKLAQELGITQKSARHLVHRIRTAFDLGGGLPSGEMKVNETYIGGRECDKHWHKQRGWGRCDTDKQATVVFRESIGQVRAFRAEQTTKNYLQGRIVENVKRGTEVYTNKYCSYQTLKGYRVSGCRP